MKFTAIIAAAVLGVSVSAISQEARDHVDDWVAKDKGLLLRYCQQPGNPCDLISEAVTKASPHLTYPDIDNSTEWSDCFKDGGSCQIAKRSAEALASAAADAYAIANPEARHRFCHLVGEPCLKVRDTTDADQLARREAEPRHRFCHLVGEPCLRRREPAPLPRHRFCHLVGEPCLKSKRFAAPAPVAQPEARHRFCHLVGEPCLKLRSAVAEVTNALSARSAEPEARHRFCHLVGEPCLKARDVDESEEDEYLAKRCNESGAPCDIAKRAAEDLSSAAGSALQEAGL